MRLFVNCLLIIGPLVLLIVGLLSVVRDLLSRNIFAAPLSTNELETPEGSIDADLGPVKLTNGSRSLVG
jgi:hypothetical protein